jgi:hypothetical protein
MRHVVGCSASNATHQPNPSSHTPHTFSANIHSTHYIHTSQYKQINFKQAQAHIHTRGCTGNRTPKHQNRSFGGPPRAQCNQIVFLVGFNAHVHPLLKLCQKVTSCNSGITGRVHYIPLEQEAFLEHCSLDVHWGMQGTCSFRKHSQEPLISIIPQHLHTMDQ